MCKTGVELYPLHSPILLMLNQPIINRRHRAGESRSRLRAPGRIAPSREEQLLLGLTILLFAYILLHFIVPLIGRPSLF